ncbi:diaminopropionate ammonia-lyase [Vogesella sp. AC12]|uniref:diaminopropionate ammonia-lyase n=1 Tax=Vogesella sp. AC12 TaxID=2950550 RepID=UPI00210E77E0|nr:diaminopropionate ammonia-lyase [Vogesella sp. AC12]MCQ4143435.1 diaminopropionate ammonia-lyase [Vogesella sp. AC12]
MLTHNPKANHGAYPDSLQTILNIRAADESRRWLVPWQRLSREATPLWRLPELAARLSIAQLAVKDESFRSELGSFKALGAPAALIRLLARLNPVLDPAQLLSSNNRGQVSGITVISATDGNHGRALAAAAQTVGCQCVIVLHAHVSAERESAIAAYGARIVRISGNYDESVTEAARLAAAHGWHVVSDTSYDGYEAIPRDVMQGYGTIAAEITEQLDAQQAEPFTHVLLQGGVGGMAAGLASYLWQHYGDQRPRFIVVEPEQADCLYQSALQGRASRATGSVDSVMAGLACGETSPLAWQVLEQAIDDFLTIQDEDAVRAMQTLAAGSPRDVPVVAGESGAAGLAGLQVLAADPARRAAVRLNGQSRVLVVNTEGATAPNVYEALVGESASSVAKRQARWMVDHAQ